MDRETLVGTCVHGLRLRKAKVRHIVTTQEGDPKLYGLEGVGQRKDTRQWEEGSSHTCIIGERERERERVRKRIVDSCLLGNIIIIESPV